jgi:hypothetical protein
MEDPKKLLQDANGYLRTAQNGMFSGKNAEAVELLIKAEEAGEKAKQQIPNDFQVTSLFRKIEKMRKDLERKGVQTRPGGNKEYPFEVQAQLSRIRELLLSKNLERAKRELDEYYARFAGPMTDIPEIKEMKEHFVKLEAEAREQEARNASDKQAEALEREKHESLCREWETRLKQIPYFEGSAQNVPQLIDEKERFRQAVDLMAEYRNVVFNAEKPLMLESIERDLQHRIGQFPERLAETAALLAGQVVEEIERHMNQLTNDTAWKSDPNVMPYFIGRRDFDSISEHIEELRPLFADIPQDMESINNALGTLHSINDQRKTECSKRIVMKAGVISGTEAEAPVKAAVEAMLKYNPGANVLKSAVVRPWEIKRTEGWYDNTKTNWIVRNLAETTVEVAAMLSDGTCKLFSLHVEKELQNDGSYGPLYGHIMFEELAVADNFR